MQYSEPLLKYRRKKKGQENVEYFKFDTGVLVHIITLSDDPTEQRPVREIGIYTRISAAREWLPDSLLIEPLTDEEVNKILWEVHDEN